MDESRLADRVGSLERLGIESLCGAGVRRKRKERGERDGRPGKVGCHDWGSRLQSELVPARVNAIRYRGSKGYLLLWSQSGALECVDDEIASERTIHNPSISALRVLLTEV